MYVLDRDARRRRFLKLAGATAIVAAAGASPRLRDGRRQGARDRGQPDGEQWGREAGEWIPSCCNMCGGQSRDPRPRRRRGRREDRAEPLEPEQLLEHLHRLLRGYTEESAAEGGVHLPEGQRRDHAALRPRPGQEAAQAHQPGQVRRRRPASGRRSLGPGARRDRGEAEGPARRRTRPTSCSGSARTTRSPTSSRTSASSTARRTTRTTRTCATWRARPRSRR